MDASQEQVVRDIAAQCPETLPVTNARAVLRVVFGEETPDCPQSQLRTNGLSQGEDSKDLLHWEESTDTLLQNEKTQLGISSLGNNIPNPYSGATVIPFTLASDVDNAQIKVYDIMGREIKVLRLGQETTQVELSLDKNDSGIYYYSLVINGEILQTKRMVLIR